MRSTSEPLVELGQALGAHGLLAFAVLLLALVGATGALWWGLQRYALPREDSRLPPLAFLLLHLALGFGVIIGAAALFAAIADELGAEDDMGRFDEAVSDAIAQATPAAAVRFFAVVTRLGDPATLAVIGVAVALLLALRRRHMLVAGWVVTLAGNALLNPALKALFARVRPVHEGGPVVADGWSFPSGHSSGAVVVYGMLAYVAVRTLPARWHLPALLCATVLAFSIACSRVFVRVHFPSDVVAGLASGLAWLAVCIVSIELSRWYRRTRR
jgi:undecaprenyl-diphosphatase